MLARVEQALKQPRLIPVAEASARLTAMKIKKGALDGFYLGSGDRKYRWIYSRLDYGM
jgi:hypothetical protein